MMPAIYKSKKVNGRRMDEHRFLMEQAIGRKLGRFEFVHHINGDKRDNRMENLVVVSPKQHALEHGQWKHPRVKVCVVCGKEFEPHPTKRARIKCCSVSCGRSLSSMKQRDPHKPRSIYREDAYPSEVAKRSLSPKRSSKP